MKLLLVFIRAVKLFFFHPYLETCFMNKGNISQNLPGEKPDEGKTRMTYGVQGCE